MKRLLLLTGLGLGLWSLTMAQEPEGPRMPNRHEILQMRGELQARQREREAARRSNQIIELKQGIGWPQDLPREDRRAALRVVHDMDSLRVICRLKPKDGKKEAEGKDDVIRLPLIHRGEYWLTLPSGRCEVELLIGYPGTGIWETVKLPEQSLQPARVYELEFGEVVERELKRSLGVSLPSKLAGEEEDSKPGEENQSQKN